MDYPPFFAFFERALAALAARTLLPLDPRALRVSAEPYASAATVWFQRLSVMLTDCLLLAGVGANAAPPALLNCRAGSGAGCRSTPKLLLLAALTVGSAGLLLVDHMHFQYNGYLMALLLLSVAAIRRVRKCG